MSETAGGTSAQNDWIKDVLGMDVAGGAPGGERPPARKDTIFGPRVGKGAAPKPDAGTQPTDKDLLAKLKALTDAADALAKRKMDMTQAKADAADFAAQGVKAEKLTDEAAKTKALTALKKRIEEETSHLAALTKSLNDIAGKGNPRAEQKAEIYKKALKDQYGIEIEVPAGMKNTHFDKVYDMFGSVPKDHVKQDKLKKLRYKDQTGYGGVYYYSDNAIEMGDFGDATGEEDYELDGKKVPANSFNVTTLHEIGHSVDDKHSIMDSNQGKAGCGGWKEETAATVTAAFVADLKGSVHLSDKVTDDMLKSVVSIALAQGTTQQPGVIENDDWQKILAYLGAKCLKVRDAAQPYFKNDAVVTGSRVFTESSPGYWWSYASAARGTTKVNNYQWRSPAEWFAEVYAISWLKKKPPPSGVDASAAEYMWKG